MKISNMHNDSLYNSYNVSLLSHQYNANFLEHFRKEIFNPPMLRFKTDMQKINELGNIIFIFINSLDTFFSELKTKNKWHPNMTAYKITSMIIETNSIIDCYNLTLNKDLLLNKVKDFCEVIYNQSTEAVPIHVVAPTPVVASTAVVAPTPVVASTHVVAPTPVETKSTKDYKVNQKKNDALLEAQEDFFKLCIPSEEKIKSTKDLLELNPKKAITANTISLEEDTIKKGTYTFSKRHYLGNAFFTNKVIKEYVRIFGDSYWVKLITDLKEPGKLIIRLDVNYKKESTA